METDGGVKASTAEKAVVFRRGPAGSKYGLGHAARGTAAGLRSAKLRERLASRPPSVDRNRPLSTRQ
jgi:hypothetical protein